MRALKGLEDMVGLSVVHWLMADDGWTFTPGPDVVPDTVNGARCLYELYVKADPACTSRVTVPVLWTSGTTPSSPTNPPKSCECSTRRSMRSARWTATITPKPCGKRSMR